MFDIARYYGEKDEQDAEIARLARDDWNDRFGQDDDDENGDD